MGKGNNLRQCSESLLVAPERIHQNDDDVVGSEEHGLVLQLGAFLTMVMAVDYK